MEGSLLISFQDHFVLAAFFEFSFLQLQVAFFLFLPITASWPFHSSFFLQVSSTLLVHYFARGA
jgi:hypothetical protein